jgi:hypothetical protein
VTDLTARELMDTILQSLARTRASFKKAAQPSADDHATLQPDQKKTRPNKTVDLQNR